MTRQRLPLAFLLTSTLLASCDRVGVDKMDERGTTALMRAAVRADSVEVAKLIASGANVNAEVPRRDIREIIDFLDRVEDLPKTHVEWTPLLYATGGRHEDPARTLTVARLLIANGADVRHETRVGESALGFAIRRSNDPGMARLLVAAGARADQRLLMFAVEKSTPAIVRLLLHVGADSSVRTLADAAPFNPLLIAATKRGDPAVVKAVIDAGYRVNARDRNGWSALRWARDAERRKPSPQATEIVAVLEAGGARDEAGTKVLALFDAVRAKDLSAVRAALRAGTNPNARDNSSVPPLIYAAIVGHVDIVSALIDAGAHVNIMPEYGSTPLTAAIENGSVATVKRLLAAGARSSQSDSKGFTPLMTAALWSRGEIMALLLADSAQIDIRAMALAVNKGDSAQVTMLLEHGAALTMGNPVLSAVSGCKEKDNTPVIRMLLQRGASTRKNPEYGMVQRAAAHCSPEALQLLIQYGADLNARDFWNGTPLHAAAKARRTDNMRVLIAAGADVNAQDPNGNLAFIYVRDAQVRRELRQLGARVVAERSR